MNIKEIELLMRRYVYRPFGRTVVRALRRNVLSDFDFIHVMNSGIHTEVILSFLNKKLPGQKQAFIFPYPTSRSREFCNLYNNCFEFDLTDIPFGNCKKIIFHGLFSNGLINEIFKRKELLSKAYWFVWGGDLHKTTQPSEEEIYVKSNFKGILTDFEKQEYVNRFGENNFFSVTYPNYLRPEYIQLPKPRKKTINILINNCCDISTLPVLDSLARFSNYNIKILTILSYVSSGQKNCFVDIIKKGYEIFGNKFCPILNFMPAKAYSNFLSDIDIYISNQSRAQGNGNASFIAQIGGKVFVKPTSSVYQRYQPIGIHYYNTDMIDSMSFEELIYYPEDHQKSTMSGLSLRASDENKKNQWLAFLNS